MAAQQHKEKYDGKVVEEEEGPPFKADHVTTCVVGICHSGKTILSTELLLAARERLGPKWYEPFGTRSSGKFKGKIEFHKEETTEEPDTSYSGGEGGRNAKFFAQFDEEKLRIAHDGERSSLSSSSDAHQFHPTLTASDGTTGAHSTMALAYEGIFPSMGPDSILQGLTIQVNKTCLEIPASRRTFSSDRGDAESIKVLFLDTPGAKDFRKRTIASLQMSDIAIHVVPIDLAPPPPPTTTTTSDAQQWSEDGIHKATKKYSPRYDEVRRKAAWREVCEFFLMAFAAGVTQVIVVISNNNRNRFEFSLEEIEAAHEQLDLEKYERLQKEISKLCKRLGYKELTLQEAMGPCETSSPAASQPQQQQQPSIVIIPCQTSYLKTRGVTQTELIDRLKAKNGTSTTAPALPPPSPVSWRFRQTTFDAHTESGGANYFLTTEVKGEEARKNVQLPVRWSDPWLRKGGWSKEEQEKKKKMTTTRSKTTEKDNFYYDADVYAFPSLLDIYLSAIRRRKESLWSGASRDVKARVASVVHSSRFQMSIFDKSKVRGSGLVVCGRVMSGTLRVPLRDIQVLGGSVPAAGLAPSSPKSVSAGGKDEQWEEDPAISLRGLIQPRVVVLGEKFPVETLHEFNTTTTEGERNRRKNYLQRGRLNHPVYPGEVPDVTIRDHAGERVITAESNHHRVAVVKAGDYVALNIRSLRQYHVHTGQLLERWPAPHSAWDEERVRRSSSEGPKQRVGSFCPNWGLLRTAITTTIAASGEVSSHQASLDMATGTSIPRLAVVFSPLGVGGKAQCPFPISAPRLARDSDGCIEVLSSSSKQQQCAPVYVGRRFRVPLKRPGFYCQDGHGYPAQWRRGKQPEASSLSPAEHEWEQKLLQERKDSLEGGNPLRAWLRERMLRPVERFVVEVVLFHHSYKLDDQVYPIITKKWNSDQHENDISLDFVKPSEFYDEELARREEEEKWRNQKGHQSSQGPQFQVFCGMQRAECRVVRVTPLKVKSLLGGPASPTYPLSQLQSIVDSREKESMEEERLVGLYGLQKARKNGRRGLSRGKDIFRTGDSCLIEFEHVPHYDSYHRRWSTHGSPFFPSRGFVVEPHDQAQQIFQPKLSRVIVRDSEDTTVAIGKVVKITAPISPYMRPDQPSALGKRAAEEDGEIQQQKNKSSSFMTPPQEYNYSHLFATQLVLRRVFPSELALKVLAFASARAIDPYA